MDDPTKSCVRCGETKPPADFGKNAASRDGLQRHCRACDKAARDARTPEQREAARRRDAAHMARKRALPGGDPSWTLDRQREWRKANPEKVRAYRQAFKANNPEKIAAWRQRDREKSAERSRRWARANPEKNAEISARRRARMRSATVGPVDLDALWTGSCGICGRELDRNLRRPDPASPSLDHIIPLSRGGSHTQDNLQWTHLTCNLRKYCKLP